MTHEEVQQQVDAYVTSPVASLEGAVLKELYRRGITGVKKPVTYQGKVVAEVTEYSDSCLMALLDYCRR